jgi:HSP20 family molecular chaperone IbpA
MMMIPKRKNEFDLIDEMFRDPFFDEPHSRMGKISQIMKTDIKEEDNVYIIEVDLPGCEKENIELSIEEGYLSITAKTKLIDDKSDKKQKYIRKERFYGECSRSFYVGDEITQEDIKASFRNGILTIEVPKKEHKEEISSKQIIQIGD